MITLKVELGYASDVFYVGIVEPYIYLFWREKMLEFSHILVRGTAVGHPAF